MRRKTPPVPHTLPGKRQRTNAIQNWHRHATDVWANAEWFMSFLDAPFFTFSEFQHIIADTMNLPSLRNHATLLQFSRMRSAMCNAVPGRFIHPRRLSAAFLAAERDELEMYRADARRSLRNLELLPATDPSTMTALPPQWWVRYRCPPPEKPSRDAPLLVRLNIPDEDPSVMKERRLPETADGHPVMPLVNTSGPPAPLPLPQTQSGDSTQRIIIRPATFLELSGSSQIIVRFVDDGSERAVADLNVMLRPAPQPSTPPPLLQQISFDCSPPAIGFGASPQISVSDPFAWDTPRCPDVTFPLSQFFPSPHHTLIQSPLRPITQQVLQNGTVECEVDVQQIAESMRLLDRKTNLLWSLRSLNDTVEHSEQQQPPVELVQHHGNLISEINTVTDELCMVVAPAAPSNPLAERLNFNSPGHEHGSSSQHVPSPHSPVDGVVKSLDFDQRLRELDSNEVEPSKDICGPSAGPTALKTEPVKRSGSLPPDVTTTDTVAQQQFPNEVSDHLGKIDFHDVPGITMLARTLAGAALAKITAEGRLKTMAPDIRPDVLECVSSCLAVLISARMTGDYECVLSAIQHIPRRLTQHSDAFEAILAAARGFGTHFQKSDRREDIANVERE